MYTRQQGEGTGKILLQPNQTPRTDKARATEIPKETPQQSQKPSADTSEVSKEPQADDKITENTVKKPRRNVKQYKARRPSRENGQTTDCKETADAKDSECLTEQSKPFDRTREQEKEFFTSKTPSPPPDLSTPQLPPQRSGLSALLNGYSTDELLIFAIIILLIMQGSDDILVLALCYVIL